MIQKPSTGPARTLAEGQRGRGRAPWVQRGATAAGAFVEGPSAQAGRKGHRHPTPRPAVARAPTAVDEQRADGVVSRRAAGEVLPASAPRAKPTGRPEVIARPEQDDRSYAVEEGVQSHVGEGAQEDGGGREGRCGADASTNASGMLLVQPLALCRLEAALRPGVLYGPRFVEF